MIESNKNIYLSIVIPVYNEEVNISSTLLDIAQYLKTKNYTYEIIMVDDGSTDKTAEFAVLEGKIFEHFTLLKHSPNRGKGYSVKEGVQAAQGEFVLFMDADNSTRINQIDRLLAAIFDGYDIAIASRRIPGAVIEEYQPFHRIIMGNTYILLSRMILGTNVKDYNCGFKLYKEGVAKKLFSQLTRKDWSFDSELIYLISKYGFKIKEVPVRWQDKRETSKVKPLRDGIKSFISLFKIRFQKRQFNS
ncbi:MAG: glycosyltransferase family 2 protein [Candidatus Omnitrophica bacterium]|jgi:dolichyl-phosphate beta-glucosyltransferase|nr:glycosyltransferase family 2 protein [Candidatus Omnitrophota bacterium]